MRLFERYHRLRILRNYPIPDRDWHQVAGRLPLLAGLAPFERARLRELATLFLHEKVFTGVQGMEVTPEMRITVAAQACLEILELGIDAFAGWTEIVVYPGAFTVKREQMDESGVVSLDENILSGESWMQGPVIFSWPDVAHDSFNRHPGRNVVIHEFAHKLDMLNGRANGMPPLHPEMPIEAWTEALSRAYGSLVRMLEHHRHPSINPYAATNPAEFFAVVCEYFFTAPHILQRHCPAVHEQLKAYFRQDPMERLSDA